MPCGYARFDVQRQAFTPFLTHILFDLSSRQSSRCIDLARGDWILNRVEDDDGGSFRMVVVSLRMRVGRLTIAAPHYVIPDLSLLRHPRPRSGIQSERQRMPLASGVRRKHGIWQSGSMPKTTGSSIELRMTMLDR